MTSAQRRTEHIQIRLTPAQKRLVRAAAKAEDRTMSEFVLSALTRSVGHPLDERIPATEERNRS
jgi:uncharacterized protein (DUF1778 family)